MKEVGKMAITPFSLSDNFTMDEFNSRIDEMNNSVTVKGITTGTGQDLALTIPNFTLANGAVICFNLHTEASAGATLNINSVGAKPIISSSGSSFSGAIAGSWVTVVYSENLNSFILQGEGGDSSSKRYQSRTFEGLMGYTILHAEANRPKSQTFTLAGVNTPKVDGVSKTSPITLTGVIDTIPLTPTSGSSTSVTANMATSQKPIQKQRIYIDLEGNTRITGATVALTFVGGTATTVTVDADQAGVYVDAPLQITAITVTTIRN